MKKTIFMLLFGLLLNATAHAAEGKAPSTASNPKGDSIVNVELVTSKGTIILELYPEKAPKTVDNFVSYVNDGFYNGTIFHRVIKNFMIQGGGFEAGMKQKETKSPIENEADNGLKNELGTIAMARTMVPHSASSQFFINVKDNDFLNFRSKDAQGWGYAVFGKVIEGMDVLKEIEGVATGVSHGHGDVPTEDVVIESARVIEAE